METATAVEPVPPSDVEPVTRVEEKMSDSIVGDGSVDMKGRPSVRDKTGVWKACSFIYVLVFGDNVAVLAIAGNMVPYLFGTLHLSVAESANSVSNFMGTTYLLPVVWGFLADSYFGRYRTIAVTGLVTVVGTVLLTVSASVPSLQPTPCTPTKENPVCPKASQYVLNWFYAAIFLIAIGSAGAKPNMSSMGQDQYDETHSGESKKGLHFFTGYLILINVTTLFNVTALYYLQQQAGFEWGYGAIAGIFLACLITFYIGTPFYRHTKPVGSPLTRMAEVVVVAIKNRKKRAPNDAGELYEQVEMDVNNKIILKLQHTEKLTCLDKAAVKPHDGTKRGAVCTVTQVEELKTVIQILPIWLTTISVYTVFSQMVSFSVVQATTLDCHMGSSFKVPAGSMAIFIVLGALIFVPIYERLIVPFLRNVTGHPQGLAPLRRIGVSLVISIFALIAAALVENRRVKTIKSHQVPLIDILQGRIPMRYYWLIPQLAILGVVDFLLGVAQLDFFYREAPNSLKSVATSLFFTTISVGYYISAALVDAVNKYTRSSGGWLSKRLNTGGLTNYYWLLAVIMAINLLIYVACANWCTYKKVDAKPHPSAEQDAII